MNNSSNVSESASLLDSSGLALFEGLGTADLTILLALVFVGSAFYLFALKT